MGSLELTLALPGGGSSEPRGSKRAADVADEEKGAPSAAKAQVVGWPPVRSFRKNAMMAGKKVESCEAAGGMYYVKVSMDGAPYLRKIDLKVYKGYKELLNAIETMFKCFTIAELSSMDNCNNVKSSEYSLTYEDKDGDWMLVGDVPFEMFISSCKKLRIMKGSEAKGLGSC